MQNGDGLYWKIAKMSETAVSAFSPPLISSMFASFLPGGWARISMPVSSMSSGLVSAARPSRRGTSREDRLKRGVHAVEGLLEEALRLAVHLLDRLLEVGEGLLEVGLLRV
jgi:hypothetical protein